MQLKQGFRWKRILKFKRIIPDGSKIIDKDTNTTDKDIETAVLDGADNLRKVQEKLKVGVSNPNCIPEVEQLIRFYKEKHGL